MAARARAKGMRDAKKKKTSTHTKKELIESEQIKINTGNYLDGWQKIVVGNPPAMS